MPRNCAAVRVGCLRNVGTGGAGGEGVDGALRSVGYALGRQRAAVGIGTAGDGVESGQRTQYRKRRSGTEDWSVAA